MVPIAPSRITMRSASSFFMASVRVMFTTSNKKPDPRAPIGSRRLAGFVFTPGRRCHYFRGGARKHSEIGASEGGYAQRGKLSIGQTAAGQPCGIFWAVMCK
jgi:hypothetical protein